MVAAPIKRTARHRGNSTNRAIALATTGGAVHPGAHFLNFSSTRTALNKIEYYYPHIL
jgi:hypothetical protein